MRKTVYQCDCCGANVDEWDSITLFGKSKMFNDFGDWFGNRRSIDICKDCWQHIGLCTNRTVDRDGKSVKREITPEINEFKETSSKNGACTLCADKEFYKFTNAFFSPYTQQNKNDYTDTWIRMRYPNAIDETSLRIKYNDKGIPCLHYKTNNGTQYIYKFSDFHKKQRSDHD